MPFISYDVNTPGEFKRITGLYSNEARARMKQHYIQVELLVFEEMKKDLNSYSVQTVDGRPTLFANTKSVSNFKVQAVAADKAKSKAAISSLLEVDGREYDPNPAFQQNLSIALGLMASLPSYTTKLWCRQNNKWEFVDHDVQMCINIAQAFDQRRIHQSQELYQNL